MTGFKNFILRGNLVELAVAFIMAGAFATVVTATVNLLLGLIGKVGGQPDFSAWEPYGLLFGAWITAIVSVRDPGRRRLLPDRQAVHRREGPVLPEPRSRAPPPTSRCSRRSATCSPPAAGTLTSDRFTAQAVNLTLVSRSFSTPA